MRAPRAVLLAAVVVGTLAACGGPASAGGPTATPTTAEPRTAQVGRGDLVTTTTVSGTVAFSSSTDLPGRVPGTITALPAAGATIGEGQTLYEVDARPVVRLDGDVPAWRALGPGVADGVDVRQLEQALADLGHAPGITVDEHWTTATAAAVRRWQAALGVTVTGTVALGDVVFTPGDVRVVAHLADLGAETSPGAPVLSIGATTRVVTASLRTGQAALAPVGGTVRLTLADGTQVDGTVTASEVVPGEGEGASSVLVTIAPAGDVLAAQLEGAPVQVDLSQTVAIDVLTVPVTALVALAEGGYGVQKIDDGGTTYVAVTPGAFAGTDVELRDGDVAEGDEVVVAP